MEYYETVVLLVMVGNDVAQVCPQCRRHVAGVDGRLKLVGVNLQIELPQLGHILQEVLEVKRLQSARLRIAVHSDSPARVDE